MSKGTKAACFSPFFIQVDMEREQAYLTALDELNVIMLEVYYSADPKQRVKNVTDELFSILVEAYLLGIDHASEMMKSFLVVDQRQMESAVYAVIAGETFADRAEKHVRNGDVAALQTLAESEYHRVYNTAVNDGVTEYIRETGAVVEKVWLTVGDDRVRDTHEDLQGVSVGVNDRFYTFDGDSALFPGGFANAQNNVNCRCWLEYRRVNS